jgi:hypothetical protein
MMMQSNSKATKRMIERICCMSHNKLIQGSATVGEYELIVSVTSCRAYLQTIAVRGTALRRDIHLHRPLQRRHH